MFSFSSSSPTPVRCKAWVLETNAQDSYPKAHHVRSGRGLRARPPPTEPSLPVYFRDSLPLSLSSLRSLSEVAQTSAAAVGSGIGRGAGQGDCP